MTQINTITATRYGADAYRERDWQIWRETLPYIMLLAGLGLACAVAAIADPLTFADISSVP